MLNSIIIVVGNTGVTFLVALQFLTVLNFISTVCTVPSLALDCSNQQNVRVTWDEDCVNSCDVIWNCTNGEDVFVEQVLIITQQKII